MKLSLTTLIILVALFLSYTIIMIGGGFNRNIENKTYIIKMYLEGGREVTSSYYLPVDSRIYVRSTNGGYSLFYETKKNSGLPWIDIERGIKAAVIDFEILEGK